MISVIIPTHRARDLEGAVRSCLAQTHPSFEVIVVFNLTEELREIPGARVIASGGLGVNRARNAGIRAARGELLFFMDDDCRMRDPEFLRRLEMVFSENPLFATIGGIYLNPPRARRAVRSYHAFTRLWLEAGIEVGDQSLTPTRNLLGGNLAVRKNVFDSGIHFRSELRSGGDETEFLRSLKNRGFKIGLDRTLSLEHHANPSWKHAVIRSWKQNRARATHRLGTGRFPPLSAKALEAWPHLALHLGVGTLAFLYGRVRGPLDRTRFRG